MPKVLRFACGLVAAICVFFCAGNDRLFAQPADLDAVIDILREKASPAPQGPDRNSTTGVKRQLLYPATLSPTAALLTRLQTLFAPYFDKPVNLILLLHRFVTESAVIEQSAGGWLLFNPTHMLLLDLSKDWKDGGPIRVATLEDLQDILGEDKSLNPILAAYAQGFEQFALLSKLMKNPSAKETLEVIWNRTPQSEHDRKRMRYLLLRPVEQTMALQSEGDDCRWAINEYVNDVRSGKRADIPRIAGVTDILTPTRFIRRTNELYLVLGERLMARYYVLVQFSINNTKCKIEREIAFFMM